ncbi:hypothetical protein vseg_011614 [Gypsophila vaccaria]
MMSAESKAEHGVIQSSIGLLQERFRQLQRMKEERQTKQLVRLFSDYKTPTPTPTPTPTTSSVSPIVLSTSNSYFTTNTATTTTTTTSASDIHDNDINNNNENDDDDNDEELQIFIPPNYMSHKNRKVSCYSSPSTTSSTVSLSSSLSSSSSSSQSRNNHRTINNLNNDVSLSLWPPTEATHCRPTMKTLGASEKAVVKNNKRPITTSSSVVSTAFTMDDDFHRFSDVDTTLHL